MIIFAVVDDRNGMMFNHRRQSQDKILRKKILTLSSDRKLWMNAYSYSLFNDMEADNIVEAENFLDLAEAGEYCFVENLQVKPYQHKIEKVLLFKWNRKYPGDFFWDIDFSDKQWKLTWQEDFAGSSHEKITMEEYCRE